MYQVCPVCGNDIYIKPTWKDTRCKMCKRNVEIVVHKRKGKSIVELREGLQSSPYKNQL